LADVREELVVTVTTPPRELVLVVLVAVPRGLPIPPMPELGPITVPEKTSPMLVQNPSKAEKTE